MCLLPKLPSLPAGLLPVIRTKAEIRAEHDARATLARAIAHVVTADEQAERERASRARKPRPERAAPEASAPAAPVEEAPAIRATVLTLAGEARSVAAASLAELIAGLSDDSSTRCVKLAEGVCLALWSGDRCVQRRYYATERAAHGAGNASLDRGDCDRFTVSNEVSRGDVLAGAPAPARDQPTPSRKRPASKRVGSVYGGNHVWNMRARESRAVFSHG
jgi:hypothetical protein